ncbi:MAG TPA: hypothetical protein VMZ90_07475 [Vicinamibacterales bacterium]|nr:hypothetical protein [Vicinamibacterales bacterium]
MLLAVLLTWPMAARLGSAGRIDSGDARHGIWNVAWVAHALTTHPASLFDANIFYPHQGTLAYSEANIVAGVVAVPVWLATKNPYASFNFVVLLAFAGAALSAFLLVRVLGGSRLGGTIAGLIYGFSPYMFAHIPHIQLLMTFGPALSMAAMHHFTKVPSLRRGLLLGLALAVTGLACAYYGVFAGLAVGVGLLWELVTQRRLRDSRFWLGVSAAVVMVLLIVGPFFVPYLSVQNAGFERSLNEARPNSTNLGAYFASAVVVHRWMLDLMVRWRLEQWSEVLFPGFLAIALATLAMVVTLRSGPGLPAVASSEASDPRRRGRPMTGLYLAIALLAFWASLGPAGVLYTLLYHVVPAFSFLRAPVRFGVLVLLALAVLSGFGVTWLEQRLSKAWGTLAAALIAVALVESYVGPLQLTAAPPVAEAYRQLAALPRAPLAEFPFYAGTSGRYRQTDYMLASTFHWQPLINGYSDYFPPDFFEATPVLETFPSPEAFALLRAKGVRWIVVHLDKYPPGVGPELRTQLAGMTDRVRVAVDEYPTSLYEVIWSTPQSVVRRP